jgi:hypothetical protein
VSLLYPDEGRRFAIEVDDDLLAEGVDAAALTARALAARRVADPSGFTADPGSYCRYCPLGAPVPEQDEPPWCTEGATWLAGPGRWPGWRAAALDDDDEDDSGAGGGGMGV